MRQAQDLEQTAHCGIVDQTVHACCEKVSLFRVGSGEEYIGAGQDTESVQPFSLTDRTMNAGAGPEGSGYRLGEINMGGKIRRAWRFQHRVGRMAAHGLEGIAHGTGNGSVIDEQGRSAMAGKARGHCCDNRLYRGSSLGKGADGRAIPHVFRQGGQGIHRAKHEAECSAIGSKTDQPLLPAMDCAFELADRQGIEELVGHHQQRSGWYGGDVVVPDHWYADTLESLPLHGDQTRTGLDQMHFQGSDEGRDRLRCPQQIRHQRPAAGPQLH